MNPLLWPLTVLTSEEQAERLLDAATQKIPDLRADGIGGTMHPPDLVHVALCNDFLVTVRRRKSIDDRRTSVEMAAMLEPWAASKRIPPVTLNGALIAAAVGAGASYKACGLATLLNLSRSDFERRLNSLTRPYHRRQE